VSQEGTTSCGHDHLFTDHKMDADMMEGRSEEDDFPMRDNLVRAMESTEFRAVTDEDDGRLGTLYGRMATYNQWAEVDSKVEGHFMERILPGAFTKTIQEQRSRLKVIFDHGMHPTIGRLPLGSLEDFVDGPEFIDYRASLFDTSYNRDLLPGLRSGVYGSSYRFDFAKARVTRNPPKSEYNPLGLPERSVNEIRMRELGPTPFPVYDGTSATVRSLTDVYYQKLLTDGPALEDGPDPVQSEPESRATVDFPVPTLDEFVRMLEE
jgi:HK97 family phage prohead protease